MVEGKLKIDALWMTIKETSSFDTMADQKEIMDDESLVMTERKRLGANDESFT